MPVTVWGMLKVRVLKVRYYWNDYLSSVMAWGTFFQNGCNVMKLCTGETVNLEVGVWKSGERERLESPRISVFFRTSSDQFWSILKVRGCVKGSGRFGEPGAATEALVGWEVDASDNGLEFSETFIAPCIIIVVDVVELTSTSGLFLTSRDTAANSFVSLCWTHCGAVGEREEMVLPHGRATLL